MCYPELQFSVHFLQIERKKGQKMLAKSTQYGLQGVHALSP